MDRADIPIEVALSIVLAAAVDGADRRQLLTALSGPPAITALPATRAGDGDGGPAGTPADRHAPALVFAFPAPAADGTDPEGPAAA